MVVYPNYPRGGGRNRDNIVGNGGGIYDTVIHSYLQYSSSCIKLEVQYHA